VGGDEPPREAVVEEQVAGAMRQAGGQRLGRVERGVDLVEVGAQAALPFERALVAEMSAASTRTIASFWIRGKPTGVTAHSRSAARPLSVSS
jgi:hypothetical protein